jgi:hypothetical protein
MAAAAAALGSVGKAVLNAMGIFWLIEEVVQRIQVAQMIQQRQQMIQMRKQQKAPPSYLKSWDWTISPGALPGRYRYTISFTGNVPTEPSGFLRHPYISVAFTMVTGMAPGNIYLTGATVEAKSPKFSYKASFDAGTIMTGASMSFEDAKATEVCLFWDFIYEMDIPKVDRQPERKDGSWIGAGGGCGGEWRPDWAYIDWPNGKLYYHRVHADPMSFGEEPFQVADALQLQSQIDALINARENLKSELKDLESLAERVARYYERVEYPDWFIRQVYDNIYQRYQELARAWKENTDAIRKLLDQLSAIAPEDASAIAKSLRDPKPMPEWTQLKAMVARPDPTGYLERVKGEMNRYRNLMVGHYAEAKSAAHKALESLWRNARDLFSAYARAKTASEKDAIVRQMLQKLPADFWNHIGDMYRALGSYSGAKGRYEQLDRFLRWYTGENVVVTEQDVELVNQILGGVTGP